MWIKSIVIAAMAGAAMLTTPATPVAANDVAPRPAGPNPFLSLVPDPSTVDYAGWRQYLAQQSATLPAAQSDAAAPALREAEPAGVQGRNDSPALAERVPGFGSGPRDVPTTRILGHLSPSLDTADVDIYRFELRAGDVFAAKVHGAGRRLSIIDPAGVEVQGSAQDLSSLYPSSSPLPHSANAIADHVASVSGTHYLAVTDGSGGYQADIQVHRPPLEREYRPQTVFLDFDGAQVDVGIFGVAPGKRTLSPLRAFLDRWGLSTADEPALIRQIVATVRENLIEDVLARGNNPGARLIIRSSQDDQDTFGRENVSRVVIGGSTAEAGFTTVGIAQSIDPGNFAHEETALVLLDFLSQPAGPGFSLNTYLTPESDRITFIGRAIGNVAAHEIGHYLGSWHTDPLNATVNLMDAGGAGFIGFFGVGPDGVGGTADDTDNDLTAADVYRPSEGFTGIEDALNRTAFALSR
jgi:hypothetical protein